MATSNNPGGAVTIGVPLFNLASNQAIRLIGRARGVNLGAIGDTPIQTLSTNNFSVYQVVVTNASASLAQAQGALYTAAAAGGTAIVAPAALSAATTAAKVVQMTVASTDNPSVNTLYFRTTTANTAAATGDVYVYGYDFS
jgi:hypothetical protein